MQRKANPGAVLLGRQTGAAAVETSTEGLQKVKKGANIRPKDFTSGFAFEENENTKSKRYMHPHVPGSIIYNSQDMETT